MFRVARRGFTLVELLVVVAIITVLIALVLPALSHARQQAQWVQCSSNERQILVAMFMYAGDNRGRLPIPYINPLLDPRNSVAIWMTGDGQYDWNIGSLWAYVGSNDVLVRQRLFACPSDPEPRMAHWNDAVRSVYEPRNFSYNFNAELHDPGQSLMTAGPVGVNLAKVSGADHKIFVAEQGAPTGEACVFWAYLESGEYIPNFIATRHFGRANMGMADGHVELFTPDTFPRVSQNFEFNGANGAVSASPLALPRYQYYIQLPR